jgi:hypothetical protein
VRDRPAFDTDEAAGSAFGAAAQGHGMLALITGHRAKPIQDATLCMPWGLVITRAYGAHISASNGRSHRAFGGDYVGGTPGKTSDGVTIRLTVRF